MHVGSLLAALQTAEHIFVVDLQCEAGTNHNIIKSNFSDICVIYTSSCVSSRVLSVSSDILVIFLGSLVHSVHFVFPPRATVSTQSQSTRSKWAERLPAKQSIWSISGWNQCLALCGVKKSVWQLQTYTFGNILVCQPKIRECHLPRFRTLWCRHTLADDFGSFIRRSDFTKVFFTLSPQKTTFLKVSVEGWLSSEHKEVADDHAI